MIPVAALLVSLTLATGPSHAAAAGARPQRVLALADDVADPVGLDPHWIFDNKTYNILNQVYDTLLRLDENNEVVPGLAERWEWLGPLRLKLSLRPGVRFHDGAPLDAEAVRSSLLRLRAVPSLVSAQFGSLDDIVADSTGTVVITTRRRDAALLRKLAVFAWIVPPGLPVKEPASSAVGTGPYRFVSWEKGREIVLERNPDYWEKGLPAYFDKVIFRFLAVERQIEALKAGALDLVTDLPGTRTLEVASRKGLRVVKARTWATPCFWFVSFRGPLGDPEVRKALNMAVDKGDLVRYAAFGNGTPIASISMPGEVGHDPALRPYPHDLDRARRMLKKAGWPADFTLRMMVVRQAEPEAKVIQAQLRRAGVKAQLTVVSMAECYKMIAEGKHRDFDLVANLAPDIMGHSAFLSEVCFHSRSAAGAGGVPGFDELYERMMGAGDEAEHGRLARELDAWIHARALGLFTYQRLRTYGLAAGIELRPRENGMLCLKDILRRNP